MFVTTFEVQRWQVHGHSGRLVTLAVPVLDGTPLYERVAPDRMPGMLASAIDEHPEHWLGSPLGGFEERGSATVLGDTCCEGGGNGACCGLLVPVWMGDDTVVWEGFWSYGSCDIPFGTRFEFALDQYRAAIESFPGVEARFVELAAADDE